MKPAKNIEIYQVVGWQEVHSLVVSEHIQAVVVVDNQPVAVDNQLEAADNLAEVVDNLAEAVDNHRIDLEVHYFLQEADSRTLGAVPCWNVD